MLFDALAVGVHVLARGRPGSDHGRPVEAGTVDSTDRILQGARTQRLTASAYTPGIGLPHVFASGCSPQLLRPSRSCTTRGHPPAPCSSPSRPLSPRPANVARCVSSTAAVAARRVWAPTLSSSPSGSRRRPELLRLGVVVNVRTVLRLQRAEEAVASSRPRDVVD